MYYFMLEQDRKLFLLDLKRILEDLPWKARVGSKLLGCKPFEIQAILLVLDNENLSNISKIKKIQTYLLMVKKSASYPANHFICWAILCLFKAAVKYQAIAKLNIEQWIQAYLDIENAKPAGRLLIKISQHRSAHRKYYQEMAMESAHALAVYLLICADQSKEKWPQCEYENIMKLADMGFSLEYILKLMVPELNQLHPKESSYYQAINILLGLLEAKVKAEPGFMSKMLDITLHLALWNARFHGEDLPLMAASHCITLLKRYLEVACIFSKHGAVLDQASIKRLHSIKLLANSWSEDLQEAKQTVLMQLYGILSENAWDKRAAMVMFRHRLKEAAGWFEEDQEIGGAASASSDQSSAGAANGRDLAP